MELKNDSVIKTLGFSLDFLVILVQSLLCMLTDVLACVVTKVEDLDTAQ